MGSDFSTIQSLLSTLESFPTTKIGGTKPFRMISTPRKGQLICAAFVVLFAVAIEGAPAECGNIKRAGAVATNSEGCAQIAMDMLEKHGSACDAAISAMLCEGILSPHTTGITGGFIATIYNHTTKTVKSLIARDIAPQTADMDMFKDIPLDKPVAGGRAVAVPGEIKGYEELHTECGKLPWKDLFEPIIKLAESSKVSNFLAKNLKLQNVKDKMGNFSSLRELLTNPDTGKVYEEGETMKRDKLAKTLELIANEGAKTLYTEDGKLANKFVAEVSALGGTVTLKDLAEYKVRWETPLSLDLDGGRKLYTAPTPGSGALLIFMLKVLKGHLTGGKDDPQSYHRIVEAMKFAYAKRGEIADAKYEGANDTLKAKVNGALHQLLDDPKFIEHVWKKIEDHKTTDHSTTYYEAKEYSPADHGTANMNIIAPNGDAIAVTATINTLFGSGEVGKETGMVYNDGMDDFAIPNKKNAYKVEPAAVNFIDKRKMPLSSMCPSLIIDKDHNVQLAIGAAGGSRITTAVAYVLSRYLYFGEPIRTAVEAPRIHHQLVPDELKYDHGKFRNPGFSQALVDGLKALGHNVIQQEPDAGFGALTAVGYDGDRLVPVFDPRRNGSADMDIFSYASADTGTFCSYQVGSQEGNLVL